MQPLVAESVPLAIHYHSAVIVWILFFCGSACHIALQIDDIARKNKWTRGNVVKAIGTKVLFRTFAVTMIFGLLWHYPLLIANALKLIGRPVGDDEAAVLAIPMNYFIAGLYGAGLDSLLGYIPGLKSWLPDLNGPVDPPLPVLGQSKP
jgi:hypothetical protein